MIAPWPIHPQPMPAESVESWIFRQAHANCSSPNEFTTSYFGKLVKCNDFDLLGEGSAAFRLIERVIGSKDIATRMTLPSFQPTLGGNKELLFWVTTLNTRRYCSRCLHEDKLGYLRLAWRFNFAPICVRHKVFLESKCSNSACKASFKPWASNPSYGLSRCYRCGAPLSETSTLTIEEVDPVYVAASHLLASLDSGRLPTDIGWSYSIVDLFRTFRFLTLLVRDVERGSHRWVGAIKNGAYVLRPGTCASHLIGQTWLLLEDWPRNIRRFIGKNRAAFNRRARESGCPQPLKEFLLPMRPQKIDVSRAYGVLQELISQNVDPTLTRIARLAGCSSNGLRAYRQLFRLACRLTNESKRRRDEQFVRRGLSQLIASERYPSFRALRPLIGCGAALRSRHQPNLRSLVLAAQQNYRLAREQKVTNALEEILDSMQVTAPIKVTKLAERIGTTRWLLTHIPACCSLIEAAKQKSADYWSSFTCRNRFCQDYGLGFTGHLKGMSRHGWKRLGRVTHAKMTCMICRKWFSVNVEKAPLQCDYSLG